MNSCLKNVSPKGWVLLLWYTEQMKLELNREDVSEEGRSSSNEFRVQWSLRSRRDSNHECVNSIDLGRIVFRKDFAPIECAPRQAVNGDT